MNFGDDLDAIAKLAAAEPSTDEIALLEGLTSVQPGQFAEFMSLDRPARHYVLRVLDGTATDADHTAFQQRADSQAIARWMLTLPAFTTSSDYDDDEV